MFKKIFFVMLFLASVAILRATNLDDSQRKNKKIVDEKIDVPVDLERNYDDLLNLWASKGKEINCEYDGEAVVLSDESTYIKRLYALPSKMELAYNDMVKGFIEMYAGRRRGQVGYMLGLGKYYFPMFEEALDREGLPLELKYLAVVESALNPIARSRVGATGLWQFMPATGKLYKLEINSLVDERRDPYKSTQAAVQYLKDMYEVYGDWNLVIAAYNCGPGNVNKAIRRSGGKRDYWEIYPYLPRETRGYVPAFIAATYIMNYYKEHNICPQEASLPALIDTLAIKKTVHFEQIADVIKVPVEEIRKLNPQFKEDIIPGEYKEYALKLPIHDLSAFITNEDTIYAHRRDELLTHKRVRNVASKGNAPASGGYATYRVKKGDTLGAIAMRNGASVSKLRRWNGLSSDKLSIGQILKVSDYIPPKQKELAEVKSNEQQKEESELVIQNGVLKRAITSTKTVETNYVVKKGDSWKSIAKKTGASVANIKKWNNKKGNALDAEWNLKILKTETVKEFVDVDRPEEEFLSIGASDITDIFENYVDSLEKPKVVSIADLMNNSSKDEYQEEETSKDSSTNAIYHKVVYGETLSQIAAKYNVTVEEILSWNNITEENSNQITRLLIILPDEDIDSRIAKNEEHKSTETAQLLVK